MDTIFCFDSEGGNIGRWHWVNSDTSTPPDMWCGLPFPFKFWGMNFWIKPKEWLEFYP